VIAVLGAIAGAALIILALGVALLWFFGWIVGQTFGQGK
jgi:hypothetical protein